MYTYHAVLKQIKTARHNSIKRGASNLPRTLQKFDIYYRQASSRSYLHIAMLDAGYVDQHYEMRTSTLTKVIRTHQIVV
eukprot:17200-Heterococcus_DN1.PRE.2